MIIRKRLISGEVPVSYAGEVAARDDSTVVIRARWERADRDLGYTIFQTGDHFTEYFFSDQCFNIMRIDAALTGELRGWYCNITRPATITADAVEYVDLYLDVWVAADGKVLVLDEDEFVAAELDAPTRQMAQAGLAEVIRWAREEIGPFDPSPRHREGGEISG